MQQQTALLKIQHPGSPMNREANLLTFQKKVLKHLAQHGLDTISYLQDPTDNNRSTATDDTLKNDLLGDIADLSMRLKALELKVLGPFSMETMAKVSSRWTGRQLFWISQETKK